MAFRRVLAPSARPGPDDLTAAMVGIGMNLGGPAAPEPNIEDTVLFASEEGMLRGDLRVLAILVTWLGVHAPRLNADRLVKLASAHTSPRVRAFWAAFARWQHADRRFARLTRAHRGKPIDLLETGSEFQVRRHGEDPRFAGSPLRVPANVLRDRPADVLMPAELAARHGGYRWRLIIGPTYRADAWSGLERDGSRSAAQLARATYCSFATAWSVRRDFAVVG